MAVIGIDLGTTNTLAVVWQEDKAVLVPNAFGEYVTPSVVGLGDDGDIVTGKIAKERLISHPHRTAASFKRFMGTRKTLGMGDREYLPEELSSILLRKMKMDAERYLGEEVKEAIISVPAYFNDHQRNATKAAAELAGIHVERLINEPSAAALAGHFARMDGEELCLVIDFGGGTLDVSVVDCFENVIEIVAVAGDNRLGGNDFDASIIEYFCREHGLQWQELAPEQQAVLSAQAERCKQMLSIQDKASLQVETASGWLESTLTREKLVQISEPLLRRINQTVQRALTDSGHTLPSIDRVALVGGSCKMPIVQEYLAFILKRSALSLEEPDTIVARGAGIYAGMKQRDESLRDIMMTDVCPFTLGTGVVSRRKGEKGILFPMIERNSMLPSSVERRFYTVQHQQTEINFTVYQGEEYFAEDNLSLGRVAIPIPPAMAGEESVLARFTYDINGILEVELSHSETETYRRLLIVGEGSKLSEEEIAQRLAELKELTIHPAEEEKNQFLIAKGMRLYTQALGESREQIRIYLDEFFYALDRQSSRDIRQARRRLEQRLDQIEERLACVGRLGDYQGFSEQMKEEDEG